MQGMEFLKFTPTQNHNDLWSISLWTPESGGYALLTILLPARNEKIIWGRITIVIVRDVAKGAIGAITAPSERYYFHIVCLNEG